VSRPFDNEWDADAPIEDGRLLAAQRVVPGGVRQRMSAVVAEEEDQRVPTVSVQGIPDCPARIRDRQE
jgi:hypothetical protein